MGLEIAKHRMNGVGSALDACRLVWKDFDFLHVILSALTRMILIPILRMSKSEVESFCEHKQRWS